MTILKHTDLVEYWRSRTQVNWCRVNGSRHWSLTTALPIINHIIGSQRISISESHNDSTTLDLGNTPHHLLKPGFQNINRDQSLFDIPDFSNLTLNSCVDHLNMLRIYLPFEKLAAERVMNNKYFNQRISAKSILSEDIQRYSDKIQIIAVFEDVLKPSKEFSSARIIHLFDQIYSAQDSTDMSAQIPDITSYDLSYTSIVSNGNLIVYDQSAQRILFSHINDFVNYLSDFTNLFQGKTIEYSAESTFINHEVDGSNVLSYIDSSHNEYSYTIGSHFDQSFIYLQEVLIGDLTDNITSYAVPVWHQTILPDRVPLFCHTVIDGYNEWLPSQFSIPYGTYTRDVLRFYYGFSDDLIKLILQLILAWTIRNATEDLVLGEINKILETILGISRTDGLYWTNTIKTLESQIDNLLTDITGISHPVVFHTDDIDLTTDVTMNVVWSMDDIYLLIQQLNTLRIIYLFDFGYDGDLNMYPSSVIMSRDQRFAASGYLSVFSAVNTIAL